MLLRFELVPPRSRNLALQRWHVILSLTTQLPFIKFQALGWVLDEQHLINAPRLKEVSYHHFISEIPVKVIYYVTSFESLSPSMVTVPLHYPVGIF